MALFLGEHAIDLFAGQPVNPDEEIVLGSLTATPTTSTQVFLPSTNIDGWNRVAVNPIPNQYIIPSGSTDIVQNGTFDISDYASVNINVPTGVSPSDFMEYNIYQDENGFICWSDTTPISDNILKVFRIKSNIINADGDTLINSSGDEIISVEE